MGKRDLDALLGVGKKPSGAKKGGAGKRDLSALLGVGKESGGAAKARKASDAGGTGQAGPERAVEAEDPGPRPSRWGAGVADDDGDAPGPAPAPVGPAGRSRWNDDEDSSDSEEDAAREAAENPGALPAAKKARPAPRKTVKIGRPGYRVTKQFDHDTRQRSLLFQVDYPEIEDGCKPRHRFMSSYEQKVEAWDKKYQYVMFAAEPYEVISFKVPNAEVDKRGDNKYFSHWEPDKKVYTLQVYFKNGPAPSRADAAAPVGGTGGYAVPASNLPPPPPPGALPPQFAPPPV